jgi:hypothetical protein
VRPRRDRWGGKASAGSRALVALMDTRWADWFEGLSFTHKSDGTTILYGPVVDQAALHSLLRRVRDLGPPIGLGNSR